MAFQPLRQINAVITRQYFEPTISWALRVMLALNAPLVVLPLVSGQFGYEIIWAAFGGYMISLTDYRGLHYKKIVIQTFETVLVVAASMLGMLVARSLWLSIFAMFFVGFCAAIIRNWSDYGGSIGVAAGFFFLFGLSNPASDSEIILRSLYLLGGCGWAVLITLASFPFRPVEPVKRSVAKVWNANTDLLVALNSGSSSVFTEKEMAVRNEINQSVSMFDRKADQQGKIKHYSLLMELRRIAALFGASLSSMHEELEILRPQLHESVAASLQKTLSAFAQCSARIALVTFTSRPDDLAMAMARLARCRAALDVLQAEVKRNRKEHPHEKSMLHFAHSIDRTYAYMEQSLNLLEQKLNLNTREYFEGYQLSFNNFVSGIQSWVIVDFLKSFLNVSSEQFRYALRVAILLCLGVFIFKFFRIDHGYWIPLTMIIVIQPYYGATRKKGMERIIGTVAGILVGGLLLLLPLSHHFFVVLLIVDSFLVAYYLRNNYKVGVFFVTVMMVVLMQLSQQGTWELIGWRILSTLIGALMAFLAGFLLWPVWENERFPALFKKALVLQHNYLKATIQLVNWELPAQQSWYRFRREAEEAYSHCFASVQRMLEEPGEKRSSYDICFSLVGAGLRINREITSVALLAERDKERKPVLSLNDFLSVAETQLLEIEKKIHEHQPIKDRSDDNFSAIRKCLEAPELQNTETNRIIKNELEKIVFEIETLSRLAGALNNRQP